MDIRSGNPHTQPANTNSSTWYRCLSWMRAQSVTVIPVFRGHYERSMIKNNLLFTPPGMREVYSLELPSCHHKNKPENSTNKWNNRLQILSLGPWRTVIPVGRELDTWDLPLCVTFAWSNIWTATPKGRFSTAKVNRKRPESRKAKAAGIYRIGYREKGDKKRNDSKYSTSFPRVWLNTRKHMCRTRRHKWNNVQSSQSLELLPP